MCDNDYYATAKAFDQVADDYDAMYGPGGNAVMSWMRRENLGLLESTFETGSRLLELGCGTGEEAVHMAISGYNVWATDVSPRMVKITREKALASNVCDRVTAVAMPASSIDVLEKDAPFDGAYCSFGALNCEPELTSVGQALSRLVRPGGAFVASVMGHTCLFEMIWFLVHGRPKRALRRISRRWQPVPVAGQDGREETIATRYLGLRAMQRAFPDFALVRARALPLLSPPPYADTLFRAHRDFWRRLEPWDRRLCERRVWRVLGDHIVLVMQKR